MLRTYQLHEANERDRERSGFTCPITRQVQRNVVGKLSIATGSLLGLLVHKNDVVDKVRGFGGLFLMILLSSLIPTALENP